MKKQEKIFRNVGGNTFKLLTESINNDDKPQNANLVREGLKKVFAAAGKELSYKRISNVGMGYIKNIADATKCALREAQEIASDYGYKDDENNQKFVKCEETNPEMTPEMTPDPSTPSSATSTNGGEKREVQIGKEILKISNKIQTQGYDQHSISAIERFATELIKMHGGTQ